MDRQEQAGRQGQELTGMPIDPEAINQAKVLAFIDLRKELVLSKLEHSHRFEENLIKSLILANGAALIVLGSALDGLMNHGACILFIRITFFLFLSGIASAAGVFFVYTKVLGKTPGHFYNQYIQYLENSIEYNQLTDYGFTKKGRLIFKTLLTFSFGFFVLGSIFGIITL
jgi:hypothetical protein